MPAIRIEDGKGRGLEAEVDGEQRLVTYSVSVSEEHYANFTHGVAFADRLRRTPTGPDDCIAWMKNVGTKTFILEGVTVSVDGACELYIEINNEGETLNVPLANVPANLNTGSGAVLDVAMYHGVDLNGGASDLVHGAEVERSIYFGATPSHHANFPADIVVEPGGIVTLWCNTAGIDVCSTLTMYQVEG